MGLYAVLALWAGMGGAADPAAEAALLRGGPTARHEAQGLVWQLPPGWTCSEGGGDTLCTEGGGSLATLRLQVDRLGGSTEQALREDRKAQLSHLAEASDLALDGMAGTLSVDHTPDKTQGFHCVTWTGYREPPAERITLAGCALGVEGRDARRAVFEAAIRSLRRSR